MKKGMKFLLAIFACLTINKINALEITRQEYEDYNITRAYIVGDYIFDLSEHNPTLKDFLVAGQSLPKGEASIIEIKIAENIDGELTREYRELLNSETLTEFPMLDVKYIYRSEIKPDNPNDEKKIIIGEKLIDLATPVLSKEEDTDELIDLIIYENGEQNHHLMIENIFEDYYLNEDFENLFEEIDGLEEFCESEKCFGIELYSVSNNQNSFIEKISINEFKLFSIIPLFPIKLNVNETKTFTIRMFLKLPERNTHYSDYSETFTLTGIDINPNYEIPNLNISLGKYEYMDGQYGYNVDIDFSDYCGDVFNPETCDVLSMYYEYENDVLVNSKIKYPPTTKAKVYLEANETKKYAIEVLLPADDEKYYYSVKSNTLSIKAPNFPTTTIPIVELNESIELVATNEEESTETYKITYKLSDEFKNYCSVNSCDSLGITLFDSFDYTELDTRSFNNELLVEVDYFDIDVSARVYIETSVGKIYGGASNIITVSNSLYGEE